MYRTLIDRAGKALALGELVILDASWSVQRWREAATEVARRTDSDLVELHCEAPAAVAAERIGRCRASGGDPSDATAEVAACVAAGRLRRGGRPDRAEWGGQDHAVQCGLGAGAGLGRPGGAGRS